MKRRCKIFEETFMCSGTHQMCYKLLCFKLHWNYVGCIFCAVPINDLTLLNKHINSHKMNPTVIIIIENLLYCLPKWSISCIMNSVEIKNYQCKSIKIMYNVVTSSLCMLEDSIWPGPVSILQLTEPPLDGSSADNRPSSVLTNTNLHTC
jgi:hypothetical protein